MSDILPIINRTYELYKTTVEINTHLEKRWRYSLGQSLEATILALLEQLIMAKHAPKPLKSNYLIAANAQLEITVLKFRLFLELGLVNETKIFQAQAKLTEIGKMLGGWLKSLT
ncbi:MAG: four helix bundle protein [bacterium]|nr:four helix bundle protein [bacterium]